MDTQKAFRFWEERERNVQGSTRSSDTPRVWSTSRKRAPARQPSVVAPPRPSPTHMASTRTRRALDDTELLKPVETVHSRPDSVAELARRLDLILSPPLTRYLQYKTCTCEFLSTFCTQCRDASENAAVTATERKEESGQRGSEVLGRRFSRNKSNSSCVKITSSGFTSYLDGPDRTEPPKVIS